MRANHFSAVAGKFLKKDSNSYKDAIVLAFTESEGQVAKLFSET